MSHNWSAMKQRLHPHSVLSGNRIRQCETSSGSRQKDTDQCLIVAISFCRHRSVPVPCENCSVETEWLPAKTDRRSERQKEWQREGVTDRRSDRQKEWQREGVTDRRSERQKEWQTEGVTERRSERQKEWQTEGVTDRRSDKREGVKDRRSDRQKEWQKEGVTDKLKWWHDLCHRWSNYRTITYYYNI